MSPQLVLLEELGHQLGGGNAETAAARLAAIGLPAPVRDWQGRLAVPVEIAEKAVEGYRLEVEAAEAKRAAYDAYVAEREQRRLAAGRAAADKAMEATYRAGLRHREESFAAVVGPSLRGSPIEQAAGRAARLEAMAEFDSKHPLKPFEKFKG